MLSYRRNRALCSHEGHGVCEIREHPEGALKLGPKLAGLQATVDRKTKFFVLFYRSPIEMMKDCIWLPEMVSFSVAGFGWPRKSCRQNRFTTTIHQLLLHHRLRV